MRFFRPIAAATAGILLSYAASAQLSGTINIPGAYPTLASAITALNTQGAGAAGVTLNLLPGYPETAPAGGYLVTASGTSAGPIVIQGNANVITANGALTAGSTTDAIFTIGGGDYITLTNFNMQENAANTVIAAATNNMTEFGVVIARSGTANGAKNNTISNNTIQLRSAGGAYTNTIGIYMSARHDYNAAFITTVANAVGGENSNNTLTGNTISGVTSGIVIIGDATNNDAGNVVGGASAALGNTINLAVSATGVTTAYTGYITTRMDGIFLLGNQAFNTSYNTVNLGTGSTLAANGIFGSTSAAGAAAYTNNITFNTISLTGAGTNQYAGIQSTAGVSTTTVNTTNNTVNVVNGAGTTYGILHSTAVGTENINNNLVTVNNGAGNGYGINHSGASVTLNMNGNTVDLSNTGTSSTWGFLYNSGSVTTAINIQNNIIKSTGSLGTTSGTVYLIYNSQSGANMTVTGNQTTGTITKTGSGGSLYFYYNNGSPGAGLETVSNNTFSNIATSGTTSVLGLSTTTSTSNTKAVNSNIINNITCGSSSSAMLLLDYFNAASIANNNKISNVTGTGSLYALSFTIGSLAATGSSTGGILQGNKVSNISSSGASSTLVGIAIYPSSGSVKVFNDTVQSLSVSGNTSPVLRGIQIATGTNDSVYQNIVNGLSATTTTGSAVINGITVSGSTTPYVYRNNINGLSAGTASGTSTQVTGITISSGSTAVNVYNNFISGLTAGAASNAGAIAGINVTATGSITTRLYFNTIALGFGAALTGTGANFGVTGIVFPSSTTNLVDVKNNIININATPAGTGIVAALRRSTATATAGTPPPATNFTAGSNIYFVPAAANTYVYVDAVDNTAAKNGYNIGGLTADAVNNIVNDAGFNTSCSQYKSFMNGRDAGSFRENNLIAGPLPATFSPTGASFAKGVAASIATPVITEDYAGTARPATADIGALQFTGTGVDATPPTITYTALPLAVYCTGSPTLIASITDASGINVASGTAPRIYFKKSTEANVFGNYPADNTSAFNGWKYTEGTGTAPNFSFTPDFAKLTSPLATGDSISYFVVAQDNAAAPNVSANNAGFASGYCPVSVNLLPAAGPLTATPAMNGYRINTAGSLTTLSSTTSICVSGTANLSLSSVPTGVTFQWQQNNGTSTYTDISGATSATYTATVTATNSFRVVLLCGGTPVGNTVPVTITVTNPTSPATTPATRCGTGPITLAATGAAGTTIRWYTAATGGSPVATGTTFTIPSISATTTFYASAGNLSTYTIGLPSNAATYGTFSQSSLSDWPSRIQVNSPVSINSVDVYPTAAGTLTLALRNSLSSTDLQTFTINVTAAQVGTLVTVPVNFQITTAGAYQITTSVGGIGRFGTFTGTYPFTGADNAVSIVGSATSSTAATATSTYNTVFNLNYTSGCESIRTAVVATVTPAPPATAATTTPGICNGSSAILTATSVGTSGYSYTWTPGNLTGASVSVSPTATTKYYLTATNSVSGCSAVDSLTITVNTQPAAPVVTPSTATICPGASVQLTSSPAALLPATFGTGTTVNSTSGYPAPLSLYYGGSKHQMLLRSSELSAAGLSAGSSIGSLSFNVSFIGTNGVTLQNYQVYMGHTTTATLGGSSFITGLTQVMTATTYPVALGVNTSTFTTPFIWNGTDNIVVETDFSNNVGGTLNDAVQMYNSDPGFSSTNWYRADNVTIASVLAATTPTSSGNARPNMVLGFSPKNSWTNPAGLFKDAALTLALASTDTNRTVYAAPVATTVFNAVSSIQGCQSNPGTATVTVSTPVATITPVGATTFCQGGSVVLNANTGTGFTYQWKLNGSNITTSGTTSTYTAAAAGSYTVVVTNANGCSATSAAVTVTVNPLPAATVTAGGPLTFCQGGSVLLTANTGTGLTYQWKLNGNNITTGGTASTYTANATGSYTVTVTNSNGCQATSAASVVTVNPLPSTTVTAGGPLTFCQGGSVLLTGPTGTGLTYQWRLNSANITTGGTAATYTASTAGVYKLVVTNGTGCSDSSAAINITVNPLPTATATPATATTFCQGGSVVLNANTGTGLTYQWKLNGNNITTGGTAASYTAAATGSYTVTVTNTSGCQATSAAVAVTVNPLPVTTVTAGGPLTFCQGGQVVLSVPTATGNTYQWRLNGANIAGATGASFTATATGSYKAVITNGTGCIDSSAASVITVNPLPVATATIAGPAAVCQGDSVRLKANTGTGLSYQWLLNGNIITGATLDSFHAGVSGSYKVRVTNASGCSDSSGFVAVTINPLPAATITPAGIVAICQNDSITLAANTGTGFTYQWQQNGVILPAVTSSSFSVNTAGIYRVTVTNSNGCKATSAGDTVIVNPLPTPVITSTAPGVLSTGTFTSYQWNLNGQAVAGATSSTYTAAQNGVYTVTVTDANGCRATSAEFTLTTVGVSNIPGNTGIRIFPNPTQGLVNVSAASKVTIMILAVDGKVILHREDTNQIDISPLPDGIYTIRVTDTKGHTVIQKLTKASW